jgi:DNA (cytosine-5)-methyltransferase 1
MVIDLFAGGGGASKGIAWALGRSPDLAINHNLDALRIHELNHPETRHLVDDIRDVSPIAATRGRPVELLWASPDCRHFSPAKGGKPCNPKIRTLPWEVMRWAREVKPRLICVENVPAMQTWGPLHEDHGHGCTSTSELEHDEEAFERCTTKHCHFSKPIKELAGTTWREWIAALEAEGYIVRYWVLTASHFGAPTSRKRLVVVARRDGVEPVCPPRTHGEGLLPERTAAECIDWSDLGESIFDEDGNTRHAPATLRRIATGVMRYVVEAKKPFIVGVGGRAAQTGDGCKPVDAPLNTITTKIDRCLVVPTLVQTGYGERVGQEPRALDIQKPLGTIVAGGCKHALVAAFLAKHYGHGPGRTGGWPGGAPLDRPMGTVTTQDHHSVVAASLAKLYGTNEAGAPADAPLGTITAGGMKHGIVAAFLSTYYGQSVGQAVDAPMATQTTKHRHAVVTVEIDGVTYAIVDIRMRMLKASELKLAQGLPESYRLEGTEKLKVALIGNSVPPQLAQAIVAANTAPRPALVRAS